MHELLGGLMARQILPSPGQRWAPDGPLPSVVLVRIPVLLVFYYLLEICTKDLQEENLRGNETSTGEQD